MYVCYTKADPLSPAVSLTHSLFPEAKEHFFCARVSLSVHSVLTVAGLCCPPMCISPVTVCCAFCQQPFELLSHLVYLLAFPCTPRGINPNASTREGVSPCKPPSVMSAVFQGGVASDSIGAHTYTHMLTYSHFSLLVPVAHCTL